MKPYPHVPTDPYSDHEDAEEHDCSRLADLFMTFAPLLPLAAILLGIYLGSRK